MRLPRIRLLCVPRRLRLGLLHPSQRLRCLLASLALAVCILWTFAMAELMSFNWFDPEPQLLPGEAEAVAAAYPLPVEAIVDGSASLAALKRIHFMYGGYNLDELLKPFISSWRRVYPDYKVYFWTDREINLLVKLRYPTWQDLYHRQLSNYLERSDTARALILNAMGGWYADIDASSLARADSVAASHSLILPLEPYVHAVSNFNKRRLVSNAIMYSVAGHPFWVYFLQRLRASLVGKAARVSTLQAVFTTGPVLLTEVAIHFIQAHTSSSGCPGYWCPHLAPPAQFMPTYDNSTLNMREKLQSYCAYTFVHPEFSEDCKRYKLHDYRNYVNSNESYTCHAFVHLNERRKQLTRNVSDIRSWGLGLTVGNDILADLV